MSKRVVPAAAHAGRNDWGAVRFQLDRSKTNLDDEMIPTVRQLHHSDRSSQHLRSD